MGRTRLAYLLSLAGYFSLFFLLLGSIALLPADHIPPRIILLLVLVGPLLFPLRGLLHGRPYTHAWSGFMALVYLVIAIGIAAGEKTFLTGLLETAAVLLWFGGSLFYGRWQSASKTSGKA